MMTIEEKSRVTRFEEKLKCSTWHAICWCILKYIKRVSFYVKGVANLLIGLLRLRLEIMQFSLYAPKSNVFFHLRRWYKLNESACCALSKWPCWSICHMSGSRSRTRFSTFSPTISYGLNISEQTNAICHPCPRISVKFLAEFQYIACNTDMYEAEAFII